MTCPHSAPKPPNDSDIVLRSNSKKRGRKDISGGNTLLDDSLGSGIQNPAKRYQSYSQSSTKKVYLTNSRKWKDLSEFVDEEVKQSNVATQRMEDLTTMFTPCAKHQGEKNTIKIRQCKLCKNQDLLA